MKPPFSHLPPAPAAETFALHSSDHVSTRTSTVPHRTARLSAGAARPPHLLLVLATTRAPLAGCHVPALSGPTRHLAVATPVLAPLALPRPGSTQHELSGYSPSPHSRQEPLAHTRGWS